jgi:protein LSM14
MDNLTRKVNEMRTNDNIRTSRQPGTGGYAAGHRGTANGPRRGGRRHSEQEGKKVEVPTTDYDFASANAKFNKGDLVKEAIASGSPVVTPTDGINGTSQLPATNGEKTETSQAIPPAGVAYNKNASFFDNISSESKERTEEGGNRRGGREFRSEERQKNLETFGQGSVDTGYRGGYGRGGRGRGRGGYGRGRGGGRGGYESRGGPHGIRGGRGAVATEG